MKHNPDAYNMGGKALHSEGLSRIIGKYLFLSKNDLDYDNIKIKFVPN